MKKEYESPVYHVRRVPVEKVRANSYNPNHVAPPEMKLLELSIWEDGYTMPCVCYYIPDEDVYELVDGYHRYCVLRTSKRVFDYCRWWLLRKTYLTEWQVPFAITVPAALIASN